MVASATRQRAGITHRPRRLQESHQGARRHHHRRQRAGISDGRRRARIARRRIRWQDPPPPDSAALPAKSPFSASPAITK
jgi:hypothetical protein